MTIAAMLRVKNEARWIDRVLASIQPVCDSIFVFDDSSEDETPEICEAMGATVLRSPFRGLDEARDKNWLLAQIRKQAPDWILAIDGDEILEDGAECKIRGALDLSVAYFTFRVLYLWDWPYQVRMDGIYANIRRGSLFRLADQPLSVHYGNTTAGGNFHCRNVPTGLRGTGHELEVKLLHLGYLHRADRLRKYAWYREHDPNNPAEDNYRHMVLGDLPELPATMRTKHAGPLKVEPLGVRSPWLEPAMANSWMEQPA